MTKLHFALAISLSLIITGCSEKTADEYIALAETKIEQDDTQSAIINLKNAIVANPQDAKSRFMLGKLYAKRGSSAAAEKELKRALELQYEPNEVLPLLANVYSLQFKHKEIIELVEKSRNIAPEVSTSLLLYKALALFQLDEPYKAKKAVADANEISSDSIYSKLGNAYVSFSEEQINDSISKVDELLEQNSDFPEAVLLKAQLEIINKNYPAAVENLESYVKLLPGLLQSRLILANAYVKNRQFEESEEILDKLLKVNESHPFINQLKSVVRYEAKDFEKAKFYSEVAIQNGMDNVSNRIVAGISSFHVSKYEQAYQHLTSIEGEVPSSHPIKKLITIIKLKLGYTADSADELSGINDLTQRDMILLSAVTQELVSSGNVKLARSLVEKTKNIKFTDPLRIAQKGLLKLSLDDLEGISDLENALSLNPEIEVAKMGLAATYIENGYYDQAIALADKWIQEEPSKLEGYILYASALIGKNDVGRAEEMYNKALEIDPANPASNIYFANKAESKDKTSEAITYLRTVLNRYPSYLPALEKYFVLQVKLGNIEEGLSIFETAVAKDQGAEKLLLLHAQAYFTIKRYQKTVDTLAKFKPSNAVPDIYWIILGDSYFNLGELSKALELSKNWVTIKPESRRAHLRLITFYELSGDIFKARASAKKASLRFEDDSKFAVLLTYFNVLMKDLPAANLSFNSLSADAKETLAGQWVEGLIQLESGNSKAALPKLKKYYSVNVSDLNATFVAKAMNSQERFNDSIAFLKQHLEQTKNMEGTRIRIKIAEVAIIKGDYDEAKEQYITVIELDKDNIRALNNLANILIKQDQVSDALDYSSRAVDLEPQNAQILDTHATVLLKLGKYEDAIEFYSRAFEADPSAIEIGIRYVQAVIKTNQVERARRIVNSLKTTDPKLKEKISDLSKSI